jgi:ferredoxin
VDAIVADRDMTAEQKPYLEINASFSRIWPVITKQKAPLPTAEEFKDVKDKRHLLEE